MHTIDELYKLVNDIGLTMLIFGAGLGLMGVLLWHDLRCEIRKLETGSGRMEAGDGD